MPKFDLENPQIEHLPPQEMAEKVFNETWQNTQVLNSLLAACKNAGKKKINITALLDKYLQK